MEATLEAPVPALVTNRARWAGRILTALPVLFMLFDSTIKFLRIEPVLEAHERLGIPNHLSYAIGAIELACLVLYLVPRTAALGAVLLTGFLGGAVAIHLRLEDPLFTHTLFPIYVGVLVWGGLYLRDARVRALFGRTS